MEGPSRSEDSANVRPDLAPVEVVDAGVSTPFLTACRDLFPTVTSVARAKGGRFLVVSNPWAASVFDTRDWHVVRTFAKTRGSVVGSALSVDASWAATIGTDNMLRIWSVADGHELAVSSLDAIPSQIVGGESRIAVLGADRTITVFSKDGTSLWRQAWSTNAEPKTIRFSADEQTLLITTATGIDRRAASDGGALAPFAINGGADLLAVSADGRTLATSRRDTNSVLLLSAVTGAPLGMTFDQTSAVKTLALSDDAAVLAVGFLFGGSLVKTTTGAVVRAWSNGLGFIDATFGDDVVALASVVGTLEIVKVGDASTVFQSGSNGVIWKGSFASPARYAFRPVGQASEVWDVVHGSRVGTFIAPRTDGNQSTTIFAPNGKLLMNYEAHPLTTLGFYWDLEKHTVGASFTYEGLTGYYPPVMQFLPDGHALVGISNEVGSFFAKTWDATNGKLLSSWPLQDPATVRVLVSPLGTYVVNSTSAFAPDGGVANARDSVLRLWDASRGVSLKTLEGHSDGMAGLAVSPDEKLLASMDNRGLVRLWSLPDGGVIRDFDLKGEPGLTSGGSLAFSPDGKTLAVTAVDWRATDRPTGLIFLLSTLDGHERARLWSYNDGGLGEVAFSPDGKHVVAGASSGARVWCLDELP